MRTLAQTGQYEVLMRAGATLTLPEHFGRVADERAVIDPDTGEVDEGKTLVFIDEVRSEAIERRLDQHDGVIEHWQIAPVIWEDDER